MWYIICTIYDFLQFFLFFELTEKGFLPSELFYA
jgi:hypothetical protein